MILPVSDLPNAKSWQPTPELRLCANRMPLVRRDCVQLAISPMCRALLTFIAIIAAESGMAGPPPKAPVEQSVEQLVALFSDGIAVGYPKYRHIEFGKIFGTEREDAVAIFNIEGFHGGNEDRQYLAFFESVEPDHTATRTSRPFRLAAVVQIGGRTWREFSWQKIKFGPASVTLTGLKYGAKDAACCPTVPIQATFLVKDGVISERK